MSEPKTINTIDERHHSTTNRSLNTNKEMSSDCLTTEESGTTAAANEEGPSLLQKLISSNALMNAFMGAPRLPLDDTVDTSGTFRNSDADCAKILEDIGSSLNVETLVNGIVSDLDLLLNSLAEGGDGDDVDECDSDGDRSKSLPDHSDSLGSQTENIPDAKCVPNEQQDTPTSLNTEAEAEAETEETSGNQDGEAVIGSSSTNDSENSAPFQPLKMASSVDPVLPFFSQTLAARLSRIKSLLYNERTSSLSSPNHNTLFRSVSTSSSSSISQFVTVASALLHALLKDDDSIKSPRADLMPTLLKNLHSLPFEARKDVASIFNYLLVCGCVNSIGGLGNGMAEEFVGSDSSTGENCSEACIISYAKTMVGFASYIEEHYVAFMAPIVAGHDIGNIHMIKGNAAIYHTKNEIPFDSSNVFRESNAIHDTTETTKVRPILSDVKTPDLALHCGSMLRSTLRHPSLYSRLVSDEHAPQFVYPFLDSFVSQPNFEVASDALETFRLILVGGGGAVVPSFQSPSLPMTSLAELESTMENIASAFLERAYTPIFEERFNPKLLSAIHSNYIIRRVSLQLLSTLLLTRSNYNVMMRYISNRSNLITIMVLLRDASAHITFDAFNVFKVFVANPNKPPEVVRILADNKVKLAKYLGGLHRDREANDEQFRDEKALVISTLEALES